MLKTPKVPGMPGWIELCSDSNWVDYHGMWARKAKDGSWYVLKWTNMIDACGECAYERDGFDRYDCQVVRLDLDDLTDEQKASALQSCGFELKDGQIITEHDGSIVAEGDTVEIVLVETSVQYGFGAPIYDSTADKYPTRLRAKCRRYAESCMCDAVKLTERLQRPVNKIGSTAEEYGKGELNAALFRAPDDVVKQIIRKMHGLPG